MSKTMQDNTSFNKENSSIENNDNIKNKIELNSENTHFLTNENFNKLRALQNEIYKLYEVSPSIRKLVNLLITKENLEQLKIQFNKQFSIL